MNTRNKGLIIVGAATLALGLIIFLVAGIIGGWDFAAFFQSTTFMWICILVGAYALFAVAWVVRDIVKRL